MTKIKLDYGKTGHIISLEHADVFLRQKQEALKDAEDALRQKLLSPDFGESLGKLLRGKKTVAIAHTDITRATPNHIIIPVLIKELLRLGIKKEDITLVNMTGSHRLQTQEELQTMLTKEVAENYTCVQHDSFDYSTMTFVGNMSDGHPLYINSAFFRADFKIATGFIEPHFFAGFSGGPKAILPGLSDIKSIMHNHNAVRIASEKATWAITEGNPVWEHIREGARLLSPDFLINVALNTEECISAIFVGAWEDTHRAGYSFVKKHAMQSVNKRYDIVITTNSGYPLDMNLYQAVKGMSTAAQIVKDGGTIIIVAECSDGIPSGSHYHQILQKASTPAQLFDLIVNSPQTLPEQWQAQIQTRIQKRANVYLFSSLSDEETAEAMLKPCRDIAKLVKQIGGSVAVLPKGPQTIPYIDNKIE